MNANQQSTAAFLMMNHYHEDNEALFKTNIGLIKQLTEEEKTIVALRLEVERLNQHLRMKNIQESFHMEAIMHYEAAIRDQQVVLQDVYDNAPQVYMCNRGRINIMTELIIEAERRTALAEVVDLTTDEEVEE